MLIGRHFHAVVAGEEISQQIGVYRILSDDCAPHPFRPLAISAQQFVVAEIAHLIANRRFGRYLLARQAGQTSASVMFGGIAGSSVALGEWCIFQRWIGRKRGASRSAAAITGTVWNL
jgi:hypothetical protein